MAWCDIQINIDAKKKIASMLEAFKNGSLLSLKVHDNGVEDEYVNMLITGVVRRSAYMLFRLRQQPEIPVVIGYDWQSIEMTIDGAKIDPRGIMLRGLEEIEWSEPRAKPRQS